MVVQPSVIMRHLFPGAVWNIPGSKKTIYLTFDDGPVAGITTQILSILEKYKAKATFFCLGKNVEENPQLFDTIVKQGHGTGNHGFNHLNGLKTRNNDYFDDIEKGADIIGSSLFRPPYGKMKPSQYTRIKKKYRIIMWDILSYDFDTERTPDECMKIVLDAVKPGSIVVFHDSLKAWPRLQKMLPITLSGLIEKEYTFGRLPDGLLPLDNASV